MAGHTDRNKGTRERNHNAQLRPEEEVFTNEPDSQPRGGTTQDGTNNDADVNCRNELVYTMKALSDLRKAYGKLDDDKFQTDQKNQDLEAEVNALKKEAERKGRETDDAFAKYDSQNVALSAKIKKLESSEAEAKKMKRDLESKLAGAVKAEKAEKAANGRAKASDQKLTMEIVALQQKLELSEEKVKQTETERDQFQAAADTERQEKEESKAKSDALLQEFKDSKRELKGKIPGDGNFRHRSMLPVISNTSILSFQAGDLSDEGPDPKPGDVFKSKFQRPDMPPRQRTPIQDVKSLVEKDLREAREKIKMEVLESNTPTKLQEPESEILREKNEAAGALKPDQERVVVKDVDVDEDLDWKKQAFDFVKRNFLLWAPYLVFVIALALVNVYLVLNWMPATAKNPNAHLYLVKYRSPDPSPIFLSNVFSEPRLDAAAKFFGLPDKIVYG